MNKIFTSVLVFFVVSMTTLVIVKATKSAFSFDTRSRASETKKERVYPNTAVNYDHTIPAYNVDNFINYIKDNPQTKNIPGSIYVGLALPKGGQCGEPRNNCAQITLENRSYNITSCAKFGFQLTQETPITVKYKQIKKFNDNIECRGTFCGTSPGLYAFSSINGSEWQKIGKTPLSWGKNGDTSDSDEEYKTTTIEPSTKYRYIMLCRAGGGPDRDSWLINSIYTEKSIIPTHNEKSCNMSVNPPRTCPAGYTCITESDFAGANGVCKKTTPTVISTNAPTAKPTPKPTIDASNEKFVIYLSPNGSNNNNGLSKNKSVKSLSKAQEILKATKPQKDVEIRIAKGTYYDSNIEWTYHNPNYFVSFLPEGYSIGSSFAATSMPIFDGKHTENWFMKVEVADGKKTNLRFYYLKIQNYINGIQLHGDRSNPSNWNGYNTFDGIIFENIGTYWKPTDLTAYGAIDTVNSRKNIIKNCTFKSILASAPKNGLLHSIYLAHYSSNNTITNNSFTDSSGPIVNMRDASNDNEITNNVFGGAIPQTVFSQWYCDHTKRTDCTKFKPGKVVGECPSWNNILRNNKMESDTNTDDDWTSIIYENELPSWCTKPSSSAVHFITSGNVIR